MGKKGKIRGAKSAGDSDDALLDEAIARAQTERQEQGASAERTDPKQLVRLMDERTIQYRMRIMRKLEKRDNEAKAVALQQAEEEERERQISELVQNRGRDFFAHKYGAAYLRRQMEVCTEEIAKKKEADEKAAILRGDNEMSFEELLAMEKRANGLV